MINHQGLRLPSSSRSIDIKRSRSSSHSDASSISAGNSSHGRHRYPEKLIDKSRRVSLLGQADVDNGASISSNLANVVSLKACLLEITMENTITEEIAPPSWGQAGLIRAERLTSSPPGNPRKRQAVAVAETDPDRPTVEREVASSLRSSRFEATPITCIHNLENEVDEDDDGSTWVFKRSALVAVSVDLLTKKKVNFEKARYTPSPDESVVLRPGDTNDKAIIWEYHDVTTAPMIVNTASPLTHKNLSFQKVTRDDFEFQAGQKIGMTIFRNFDVTPEDAGISQNSITADELLLIYGRKDRVNIYTGQITNVSPDKKAFEQNINTFRGCYGAVIFLLDQGQERCGVIESDYGKAIAVHVGGDRLSGGTIINFAFKIL